MWEKINNPEVWFLLSIAFTSSAVYWSMQKDRFHEIAYPKKEFLKKMGLSDEQISLQEESDKDFAKNNILLADKRFMYSLALLILIIFFFFNSI